MMISEYENYEQILASIANDIERWIIIFVKNTIKS